MKMDHTLQNYVDNETRKVLAAVPATHNFVAGELVKRALLHVLKQFNLIDRLETPDGSDYWRVTWQFVEEVDRDAYEEALTLCMDEVNDR